MTVRKPDDAARIDKACCYAWSSAGKYRIRKHEGAIDAAISRES